MRNASIAAGGGYCFVNAGLSDEFTVVALEVEGAVSTGLSSGNQSAEV
jgi:hypothetical protein